MKPAVEVSITSWKKNVVKPGQEYGRVLLMPGTGYNCDRPLLYWSAQALVEAGWRIDRMNVRNASDDLSTVIPVLNQAIDGWVAAARESGWWMCLRCRSCVWGFSMRWGCWADFFTPVTVRKAPGLFCRSI